MPKPFFIDHKKKLQEIIRVDHAGEFGAQQIYLGQIKYTKDPEELKLLNHMLEQEQEHLDYFTEKIKLTEARPTALMPLWQIGGYILGAVSAKMGKETAMLVTEGVEEVIENHYQEQIDYLQEFDAGSPMLEKIKKFKQDEADHKHIAIEHDSTNAPARIVLLQLVKNICKSAIYISKKI